MPDARKRRRLSHESRAFLVALLGGVPGLIALMWLLFQPAHDNLIRVTVLGFTLIVWLACAWWVREQLIRPFHTLSNMLAAMRERDYSIRARGASTESAVGLALHEMNALAETMRNQRREAIESTALLRRVLDSIDVAVFAFDDTGRLRLLNRAAEAMVGVAERAIGRDAASLGLAGVLDGDAPRLIELSHARLGRWQLRRGEYRQDGRPYRLVLLSDLTRSLHEEERLAWRRLVRVLSHEINNSLAPIQSIAGSLVSRFEHATPEVLDEGREGLAVIEARARSLGRFMGHYAQLAKLPSPRPVRMRVGDWVRRVARLETRLQVAVEEGPTLELDADGDQLDQLLINLVQNAADAALATGGGVRLTWNREDSAVELQVIDEGPGIADTANLFVPFFTTKPEGSGIGLALCRQIAEAHGGSVALENRAGVRGCVARVRLPLR